VAQAREAEVWRHLSQAAEFETKGEYSQGEQECRAALLIDPQNADVYTLLSVELGMQKRLDEAIDVARQGIRVDPNNEAVRIWLAAVLANKGDWDGAIAECRELLRIDPENDRGHAILGVALGKKGDADGGIAEMREALRLNPNNEEAHFNMGVALRTKGDTDGEIREYREALRLNPNNAEAHDSLGLALGNKGDRDAEIAEEREALRLNPRDDIAHHNLAVAFSTKGNWDAVITQEREALRWNPDLAQAHFLLGMALKNNGDSDGAIVEEREALRLKPDDDAAHALLGIALADKGDGDGAIAEAREAVRLNPGGDLGHFSLGLALEKKGDRRTALEEYRAAYMLDPKDANYKQNYERLLQQVPSGEQGAKGGAQSANTGVSLGPVRENPKGGLGKSKTLADCVRGWGPNEHGMGDLYRYLGDRYVQSKDWACVALTYSGALELEPNKFGARRHGDLAYALSTVGDYIGADREYRDLLTMKTSKATEIWAKKNLETMAPYVEMQRQQAAGVQKPESLLRMTYDQVRAIYPTTETNAADPTESSHSRRCSVDDPAGQFLGSKASMLLFEFENDVLVSARLEFFTDPGISDPPATIIPISSMEQIYGPATATRDRGTELFGFHDTYWTFKDFTIRYEKPLTPGAINFDIEFNATMVK
jgi:tetratricopeptide (TPR) repeat protein